MKVTGHTTAHVFRHYDTADLVIAGDGPLETELRRQAAGLEHVRFLGRVHPDALRALYADAVAVLVPSLAYETFGLIALEAFRQRTPVIGRDLGAVGEILGESGGGIAYETESELIEAMDRLRTDCAQRDELGGLGHAAFVARWSEEPHLEAYFDAIDEARNLQPTRNSRRKR